MRKLRLAVIRWFTLPRTTRAWEQVHEDALLEHLKRTYMGHMRDAAGKFMIISAASNHATRAVHVLRKTYEDASPDEV